VTAAREVLPVVLGLAVVVLLLLGLVAVLLLVRARRGTDGS
jgi:hypothetical protein